MLVLLPPSEGKAAPRRGKALDLAKVSHPELDPTREKILDALIELCESQPDRAAKALGLGPTQTDVVARNAKLATLPTARADHVYAGVLYAALDIGGLDPAAKRRASRQLATASALFGLVRPGDRIPAYRLSADTVLPEVGAVSSAWRLPLAELLPDLLGGGLLVDLRSQGYAAFYRPKGQFAKRTVSVRVLHEHRGQRKVVSHFNKATKGRIVRDLLTAGASPRTITGFEAALRDLGWVTERDGQRIDVVVEEL